MKYLDIKKFKEINFEKFQKQSPYPFMELRTPIFQDKFELLIKNLPDFSLFEKDFGKERKYGQKSHDRFVLEYTKKLEIPKVWKELIKELESEEYKQIIKSLFNVKDFEIRFHWHYATNGCSVSAHTDGLKKIGSQIFYLNTNKDWDLTWGGETLVLEDKENKIPFNSAPKLKDFSKIIKSMPINNNSFIFARTDNAWHAVDEIKCPKGKYRKVFIVVFDKKKTLKEKLLIFLSKIRRKLK